MAQYEVTLRDYWRIMRRRKGIVIFTVVLLGFFSFLIAHLWKPEPIYKAVSKVQINSPESLASINAQYMGFGGGGTDQLETQRSIITSFPVIRRTAQHLGLFDDCHTEEDSTEMVLGLQAHITTSQEGYTNIIGIEATGSRPESARELADAVAVMFADYNNAQKNEKAKQHRIFVEEQREQARRTLALAEDSVQAYREEQQLVSIDAQASVILNQINTAKQELQRLEQDVRGIDAMLAEISEKKGLSERTMQGASRTRVGDAFLNLSQQLNNLLLERNAMLVQYTEDHPKVQQIQVKVDELNKSLKDELRARRQVLARDLEAARDLLGNSQAEYDLLPSKGLELGRLQREVSLRQQVVGVLEEEYQNARIREADRIEEVTVLQRAVTPSTPTNPQNPIQRGMMGVILGLVLGIVFAVVAESLDTSIGTVEDVQEYTGTQVVGIIPYIDIDDVRASLRRRGLDVSDEKTVQRKAQLVAFFDPQSTMAESYRTLRTNIEFVTVEKGVKCLMVTSSMLREGKSTTIANLAMTMAQLGKRTLLVDCDLRKPTMAKLFGLDKEPGMTEVIVGNYDWHQVIRTVTDIVTGGMGMEDILQTQGISNLHIIPSGSIPPNPAELLNSRRMTDFIAEVREAYDVVLFDSPPSLQVTDAAILGKKVDGALVVYKVGEISRTSLKRSTSLLKSVQIELLGIVLNGLHADVSVEYQDLGYYSYYGYGAESRSQPRTLREKFEDKYRKFKNRFTNAEEPPVSSAAATDAEDADLDADIDAEEEEEAEGDGERRSASRAVGALVSALSLLAVGLGLVWQSGYLAKPLGMVPLLAEYPPREALVLPPPAAVGEQAAPPGEDTIAAMESTPEDRALAAAEEEMVVEGEPVAAEVPAEVLPEPEPEPAPVEPPPSAALRNTASPRSGPQPYVIHVASYPPDSKWEQRTLEQLRAKNLEAFLSPVVVKNQPYRRLLVGSFSSANEARRRAAQLQQQGLLEKYKILRLPYAVELAGSSPPGQARGALAQLGKKAEIAYVQPLSESTARVLAGAFEDAAAAQRFIENETGGSGRVVPR
ncbi:MAG: polysaccharide biosynthesis tyrosine autokinase [Candidatus Latescibacteria bacterium]|nr:polysaccharide biosynthesis tyrosine autokinase [Candidatus Latescibacterota bacterium]